MIKLGELLNEVLQEKSCWKGYIARGTKKKGDRMVPNCVPLEEKEELEEAFKLYCVLYNITNIAKVINPVKIMFMFLIFLHYFFLFYFIFKPFYYSKTYFFIFLILF